MLQFNLLRPEWTGIIKQNLSYDGEPVSSVSAVISLRVGRQGNITRFSTKDNFFFSVTLFCGQTQSPVQWIQGALLPEAKRTGVHLTIAGYCQIINYWVRERERRMSYTVVRRSYKSLARPGRKQANISVRMAWILFGALPCRKKTCWQLASRCC